MLELVLWFRRPAVQQTILAIIGGIFVGGFIVLKPTEREVLRVVPWATSPPSDVRPGGLQKGVVKTYSVAQGSVKQAAVKLGAHAARQEAESKRMGRLVREEVALVSPPPLPSHLTAEWMKAHRADVALAGSCIDQNSARKGEEVEDPSKEESPELCQALCRCLEGCAFFTYWPDGHCHAQKESSIPFTAVGAKSGPGVCGEGEAGSDGEEAEELLEVNVDIQPVAPGPLLYVYELPERFRNGGKDPDCWTEDCIFGGPPEIVHGIEIWSSSQFHMPRHVYHRFLKSSRRTRNVEEAEVFLIPAYSFKPDKETQCADNQDLFDTLYQLNPLLKQKSWATEKGPRHLFVDARGWETCNYVWELKHPFRLFHRINIELNGMLPTGPEDWTDRKPFIWYQFPYPAVYHGHPDAVPAKLRKRGPAKYLWSFAGTGRGLAGHLRQLLMKQCTKCNSCSKQTSLKEVSGELHEFTTRDMTAEPSDYARLSDLKLHSTFCVEPPGDTTTWKSLIDSMVLGCIPVIFAHQELDMFEAFFTAEEFAAAILYVPEVRILGKTGKVSVFGKGPAGRKKKMLQSLYPNEAEVFNALDDPSEQTREQNMRELYAKAEKMSTILGSVSAADIRRKQDALAQIAPRMVLSTDDSGRDALRILLDRIVSEDKLARKRSKESNM